MTRDTWERDVLGPARVRTPDRRPAFETASGCAIDVVYTPDDVAAPGDRAFTDPIAWPVTGDRAESWTMRQGGGCGTPARANVRLREVLAAGAGGISVTGDRPTCRGLDPDHEHARDDVGRLGVSISTVDDMTALFEHVPIDTTSVVLDGGGATPVLLALYLAAAERRGISWDALSGTPGHDVLTGLVAGQAMLFPRRASLRLATDVTMFVAGALPRWSPAIIDGPCLRAAGADPQLELSFALAIAVEYLERGRASGLPVAALAPRLTFAFDVSSDFFEEMAKLRAARIGWARILRERFGTTDDRACIMQLHARTSGTSLTAEQPDNNVVRTALQALAAVLGGAASVQTTTRSDASGAASGDDVVLALRTQQIVAHESGLGGRVDPFGGAWWIERHTRDMAGRALADVDDMTRRGGMPDAIEAGVPQQRLADAVRRRQAAIDAARVRIVGVNVHADADEPSAAARDDWSHEAGEEQRARLTAVRAGRDAARVERALADLARAAAGTRNVMEALVDGARASASLGEMCDVLRSTWGPGDDEHVS